MCSYKIHRSNHFCCVSHQKKVFGFDRNTVLLNVQNNSVYSGERDLFWWLACLCLMYFLFYVYVSVSAAIFSYISVGFLSLANQISN